MLLIGASFKIADGRLGSIRMFVVMFVASAGGSHLKAFGAATKNSTVCRNQKKT